MKKNCILWSVIVAALMAVCSCSSKTDELLNLVPADAEYVVFGCPRAIVESAGGQLNGTELKLPAWVEDRLSTRDEEDFEEFQEKLKKSGIDTESLVVTGSTTEDYVICIVSIEDKGMFVKFVKDEMELDDQDKEDGLEIFTPDGRNKRQCVVISGSHAYLFANNGWKDVNGKRKVARLIEEAKDSPFGRTAMGKFISSGNAFGFSYKIPASVRREIKNYHDIPAYMANLAKGYYCAKWTLTDNTAEGEVKMFDEDGNSTDSKAFEKLIDIKAKVNKDALAYMGKNETAVGAASLSDIDWEELIDIISKFGRLSRSDRQMLGVVGDYLKNIDGTVAMGFGLTNGLESVANLNRGRDVTDQFDFTLVIETKDGKASKLMSEIGDLLDQARLPYTGSASKGFTVEIEPITFYLAANDNFLIASNHKIEKSGASPATKTFNFSSYIAALAVSLDKDNQLLKDLGVDGDIDFSYAVDVENSGLKIKLEVKDGKGKGVIEKIANICIGISEGDYSSYFPSYSRYDYYDDYVVEEVVEYDWAEADSVAVYY